MSEQTPQGRDNYYLLDPESAAEMGRLLVQGRLMTEAMGGLFPVYVDPTKLYRVLDIGCGPGGWVLDVAKKYPFMDVTGIDVSTLMVAYAESQAIRETVPNAHFEVMSALEGLKFPDGYFDYINMRAAVAFIPRQAWPQLLQECARVTRAGGMLSLTETDHLGCTTSAAFERLNQICAHMLHQLNYGFSPNGATLGMTPMLGKLLGEAGYGYIQYQPHVIHFSYGTPLHPSQVQNLMTLFKDGSIIVKRGFATEEEMQRLYLQLGEEMQAEDFRAVAYLLTASGQKKP